VPAGTPLWMRVKAAFTGIPILAITVGLIMAAGFSCSGKIESDTLKIGLSEEPRTLNIWLASDANSRKILSHIYQPLYRPEPGTLKLVPWLAEKQPEFDPETVSYTVKIRPAKWSDGSDITSEDVAFTARLIKEFKVPRFASKWNFVKKIGTPDRHTVKYYLKEPMAIFLSRSLTGPVVQKREWDAIARAAKKREKPLAALLNHKIEKPVSSGPFVLEQWRQGSYLHLKRNPYFFGKDLTIGGLKLGPHLDGLIFKIYGTSDVAVLALKKGAIDMFWQGIQPGYLADLENSSHIRVISSTKSALYFMGFNLRKSPFNDLNLRRAAATLIDRDFIVSRILQGYGEKMFTVVPRENEFWSCPDVDHYGEGLSRGQRIKRAYDILRKNGYTWKIPPVDAAGNVVKAKGIRLPDGTPMERFTLLTPPADYDPHRAMSGLMIQEWFRDMGMPAYSRPMSFGALLQQIKVKHDFESFILGYGKLPIDPDYVRSFFHSKNDKPRGWNMSGYRNADFDRMADQSRKILDPAQRRKLIWKMQMLISRDLPYIPLYKPALIEAVRDDRFSGWVEMQDGIGNIWSFCRLKPVVSYKVKK
jgi:peptide/nickel transport system substrate-binding protein